LSAAERQAEWEGLRRAYQGIFPKNLPERIGDAVFLVFDEDWTPRGIPSVEKPITLWSRWLSGRFGAAVEKLYADRLA